MARLTSLPSQSVIDGMQGTIDYYQWLGIPVARSWPRYKPHPVSPEERAAQTTFTYANQLALTLPANVVESWHYLADQSELTWRDWLTRAYIGGTLTAPGMPPM